MRRGHRLLTHTHSAPATVRRRGLAVIAMHSDSDNRVELTDLVDLTLEMVFTLTNTARIKFGIGGIRGMSNPLVGRL